MGARQGLAWLGRHGSKVIALGVFAGAPPAAAARGLLRPLLIAALADRAAFELVVFVAMAQLPIYTLPMLQRPHYRRWLAGSSATLSRGRLGAGDNHAGKPRGP